MRETKTDKLLAFVIHYDDESSVIHLQGYPHPIAEIKHHNHKAISHLFANSPQTLAKLDNLRKVNAELVEALKEQLSGTKNMLLQGHRQSRGDHRMLKNHVVFDKTDGHKCSFDVTGVENYSSWNAKSCLIKLRNGSGFMVKGTFDEVTKKLEAAE